MNAHSSRSGGAIERRTFLKGAAGLASVAVAGAGASAPAATSAPAAASATASGGRSLGDLLTLGFGGLVVAALLGLPIADWRSRRREV